MSKSEILHRFYEFYCGFCGHRVLRPKDDIVYCDICADRSNGYMRSRMTRAETNKETNEKATR